MLTITTEQNGSIPVIKISGSMDAIDIPVLTVNIDRILARDDFLSLRTYSNSKNFYRPAEKF